MLLLLGSYFSQVELEKLRRIAEGDDGAGQRNEEAVCVVGPQCLFLASEVFVVASWAYGNLTSGQTRWVLAMVVYPRLDPRRSSLWTLNDLRSYSWLPCKTPLCDNQRTGE